MLSSTGWGRRGGLSKEHNGLVLGSHLLLFWGLVFDFFRELLPVTAASLCFLCQVKKHKR